MAGLRRELVVVHSVVGVVPAVHSFGDDASPFATRRCQTDVEGGSATIFCERHVAHQRRRRARNRIERTKDRPSVRPSVPLVAVGGPGPRLLEPWLSVALVRLRLLQAAAAASVEWQSLL